MLSYAADAVVVVAADGTVRWASPSLPRAFGVELADVVGANMADLLHPDDRDRAVGAFANTLSAEGYRVPVEFRVLANGRWIRVEAIAINALSDERVGGVVISLRQVDLRRQADLALEEIARGAPLGQVLSRLCVLAEDLIEVSACVVLQRDRSQRVRCAASGSRAAQLVAAFDQLPDGSASWARLRGAENSGSHQLAIDSAAGITARRLGFGWVTLFPLAEIAGQPLGWLAVISRHADAVGPSERQLLEHPVALASLALERDAAMADLVHQASHDALTGLPNRGRLVDDLARGLNRPAGTHLAVLFVDVDEFKQVNDHYGHGFGDEVLTRLAERLRGATRSEDFVARYGGDEFVVVCHELAGAQEAVAVAERLIAALSRPIDVEGESFQLAASIGIAIAEEDADPEGLLAAADEAMYEAKRSGPGRWALHASAARAVLSEWAT